MTDSAYFTNSYYSCAALHIDLELGLVKNAAGDCQRLSPINLKLLAHLLRHPGEVLSRNTLFDAIWPNQTINDEVLTRAISDIRTQLAKLDATNKFIETLPKRGYRWAVDIQPVVIETTMATAILAEDVLPKTQPVKPIPATARLLKNGLLYASLALLLAAAMLSAISEFTHPQGLRLAVLPMQADHPLAQPLANKVNEALLSVLRQNLKLQLLSSAAIASRPQNPFPYFFTEFGAKWVLESRVDNTEGINNITLSLVDARTGLELRNLHLNASSHSELLAKLAKKVNTELLVDDVGY